MTLNFILVALCSYIALPFMIRFCMWIVNPSMAAAHTTKELLLFSTLICAVLVWPVEAVIMHERQVLNDERAICEEKGGEFLYESQYVTACIEKKALKKSRQIYNSGRIKLSEESK